MDIQSRKYLLPGPLQKLSVPGSEGNQVSTDSNFLPSRLSLRRHGCPPSAFAAHPVGCGHRLLAQISTDPFSFPQELTKTTLPTSWASRYCHMTMSSHCAINHKNLHALSSASGWMSKTKKALSDGRAKKWKVLPHLQITTRKQAASQPQGLLCYHEPPCSWSVRSGSLQHVLPDQPAPLNPKPVTSCFIILI